MTYVRNGKLLCMMLGCKIENLHWRTNSPLPCVQVKWCSKMDSCTPWWSSFGRSSTASRSCERPALELFIMLAQASWFLCTGIAVENECCPRVLWLGPCCAALRRC